MAFSWNILNSKDDIVTAPASAAEAVTPHDTNALAEYSRGLYVGGAGNITCRLVDDTNDTVFTAVPSGAILPIRVSHVRATGTTATSIVAMR